MAGCLCMGEAEGVDPTFTSMPFETLRQCMRLGKDTDDTMTFFCGVAVGDR